MNIIETLMILIISIGFGVFVMLTFALMYEMSFAIKHNMAFELRNVIDDVILNPLSIPIIFIMSVMMFILVLT